MEVRTVDRLAAEGIRRLGSPRAGFRWRTADGRRPVREVLERIRALRIPPAWTDVRVAPLATAKVQAIGKDRAGRVQYRYHPEFQRRRASAKYRRLLRFAAALPRIRAAVARDLRRGDLSRAHVLAAMVRLTDCCHMRPGSRAYARDHGTYGLTTLRPRHARVAGDRVVFDYRGKSGRRQVRELRDAAVARLVRRLLALPGGDLFKFLDGGEAVDVRRRHLNAYLRELSGKPFTAKDFRTWAGTLVCASALCRCAPATTAASRKRAVRAAVEAAADRLGNTPAVARGSYVSPAVFAAFARGRTLGVGLAPGEVVVRARGLHPAERALVALLRSTVRPPVSAGLRLLRGGRHAAAADGTLRAAAGATARPPRRAARV
jgi:DNA topoisomerase-1